MKWFTRAVILSSQISLLLLYRIGLSSCHGACDFHCASGCAIKGPEKCDSSCKVGYFLVTSNAAYTCRAMNYYRIPGTYQYNRVALNVSTRNYFVINVRIANDIFIALTRDPDNYTANTMYEIDIGGWANVQSVIRKAPLGTDLVAVRTLNFLDVNNFNSFWISWINGVIQVGKGTVVGSDMFMSYTDASPSPVNYVALSGWNIAGSAIINDECDVYCASGCPVQGPGKCDSSCKTGYNLVMSDVAYTCKAMNYYSIPGTYQYFRVALNVSTRNSLVMNVRILKDIFVGLTRDPDSYIANTMYEIIIGGWTNTQSVIRKEKGGTNLVTVSTPNFLSVNYFNSFWISWINGLIQVGKGTFVGNDMFMSYNDTSPSAVNYVALSGYAAAESVFFNDECDIYCASGCAIQGPGKCDSSCKTGYNLVMSDVAYTCKEMNYISIPGMYYYERVALDLSTRNSIVISARISNDLHIGLTRDPDNYTANTMYEIAIGSWTNTQSVIRRAQLGTELVKVSTPQFLDSSCFNAFWISWINGVIQVGKGTVVGNDIFMSYNDTSPSAVNYVFLSGWNTPGSAFFYDDDSTKSNNTIFNRHFNVRLNIPSVGSPVVALSPTHCCALCRKISGCRSVNYRRRSSKGDVNCVPLGVSVITMCMAVSDPDWDWFSVDN